jgi:hypothetical protein
MILEFKKMLKRGYIILFVGGILLVTGLVLSLFIVGSFAGQFMRENVVLSKTIVGPSEPVNVILQVNDTSRPVSVALHSSEIESANVSLRESIQDPSGRTVNTNEFSETFFTTFKPNMTGEYTLLISNLGSNHVNIDGVFGFIPSTGSGGNEQAILNLLNSILTGVILFIIGIITLIAGITIVILDRRRGKRRPLTR